VFKRPKTGCASDRSAIGTGYWYINNAIRIQLRHRKRCANACIRTLSTDFTRCTKHRIWV